MLILNEIYFRLKMKWNARRQECLFEIFVGSRICENKFTGPHVVYTSYSYFNFRVVRGTLKSSGLHQGFIKSPPEQIFLLNVLRVSEFWISFQWSEESFFPPEFLPYHIESLTQSVLKRVAQEIFYQSYY